MSHVHFSTVALILCVHIEICSSQTSMFIVSFELPNLTDKGMLLPLDGDLLRGLLSIHLVLSSGFLLLPLPRPPAPKSSESESTMCFRRQL